MTLLAALRGGRWTRCGPECWNAQHEPCVCICGGLMHAVGHEEAARRIATLDVTALSGAVYLVVMPELPFAALGAAQEPVTGVARPAPLPVRHRLRETHCEGCGRPWTDVALVAMVDAGFLCQLCYTSLLRKVAG